MLNTSPKKFEYLVNQIQCTNQITFSNDKIDLGDIDHTKALYISLLCKGFMVVGGLW